MIGHTLFQPGDGAKRNTRLAPILELDGDTQRPIPNANLLHDVSIKSSIYTGDSPSLTLLTPEQEKESGYGRADLWELQRVMIKQLRQAGTQLCWDEADRLEHCGSRGVGFACEGADCTRRTGRLVSCSSRFCVFCNRARSAKNYEKYEACVVQMHKPMFLTLTQRDVPGESLESARDRIIHAFKLLRDSLLWDMHVIGGIYSLEFTEKVDKKQHVSWHVHLHAIIDTEDGYIPLFPRLWSKERVPGYKWSKKRKLWYEPEEKHEDRLIQALDKSEETLGRIKTFGASHARLLRQIDKNHEYARDLELDAKIEALNAQYKADRAHYRATTTLSEAWYRATQKAADTAGIGRAAYGVWLEAMGSIDAKEKRLREVLKYACKPVTISGPGLAECVAWMRESRRQLISKFGGLYGVKSEDKEAPSCPCCGQAGALRMIGSIDSICTTISIESLRNKPDSAAESMRDLLGILQDVTGGKRPPPNDHGWGRQAARVAHRSQRWDDYLLETTGLGAYLRGAEDGA